MELEKMSMLRKLQEQQTRQDKDEQHWQLNKDDDQKQGKKEARNLIEEKRMEMRKRIKEKIQQVVEMEEQQALHPDKPKEGIELFDLEVEQQAAEVVME